MGLAYAVVLRRSRFSQPERQPNENDHSYISLMAVETLPKVNAGGTGYLLVANVATVALALILRWQLDTLPWP